MEIYVVFGKCGEYSDRTEWPVVAYTQESDAQAHVAAATAKAREIGEAIQTYDGDDWAYEVKMCQSNQFDPKMRISYTGTSYYLVAVDLTTERLAEGVA